MARSNILAALVALLALSVATTGCDARIVGGGDDGALDGDDDGDDDGDPCCEGDYCCEPQQPGSLAYAQTMGDSVRLVISSSPLACGAEPMMPEACTGQEAFWLDVTIPLVRLVPGEILLDEWTIETFGDLQRAVRSAAPQDCWSHPFSGMGSIEILSVDSDFVELRTHDALGAIDGSSPGEFTAVRCGNETAVAPESLRALAYRYDVDRGSEDEGTSSTQTGGSGDGGAEEGRLVVVITDHDAATCWNPHASPDCPAEGRDVSVSIPLSRNFVGSVIDLSDETNAMASDEQGFDDGTCWSITNEVSLPGTMTIVTAGQGTIDVAFAGTGDALMDGTHTVTLCD